jgi:hypothetical protein
LQVRRDTPTPSPAVRARLPAGRVFAEELLIITCAARALDFDDVDEGLEP